MNMTRWLVVAALGLLGSSLAHADSVPGHYQIILTDWDADQQFSFIPNVDIPGGLGNDPCYPSGDVCGDPGVGLANGGKSMPENGEYSFNTSQNPPCTPIDPTVGLPPYVLPGTPGVSCSFYNTGAPITTVEITTVLTPDESGPLVPFSCYSDIFQDCAFVNDSFDIYFWDPYVAGGIATATPEPAQWFILLLAFAGIIVAWARKRSASSSLARTQQSVCPTRDS